VQYGFLLPEVEDPEGWAARQQGGGAGNGGGRSGGVPRRRKGKAGQGKAGQQRRAQAGAAARRLPPLSIVDAHNFTAADLRATHYGPPARVASSECGAGPRAPADLLARGAGRGSQARVWPCVPHWGRALAGPTRLLTERGF
jgi:hypothetical protein